MIAAVIATIVMGVIAAVVYVGRERLGAQGLGLAALRTVALGALFLALFNPGRLQRAPSGAPSVSLRRWLGCRSC